MALDHSRWGACGEEFIGIVPRLFEKTGCDDWQLARAPVSRNGSRIFFLKSQRFVHPGVVIKMHRKDAVTRGFVKRVHKHSQRLHGAMTPACRIPAPLFFFQDQNTIGMEYVDAPTAGSILMRGFRTGDGRARLVRMAGGWLRWFHEQSDLRIEPAERKGVSGKLEKSLGKISRLEEGFLESDRFLSECLAMAGKVATRLEGRSLHHALSHGDFTPFNLLAAVDAVIGFDYRARSRRPVFYDVSRFLVYLDVCRVNHDHVGLGALRGPHRSELRRFGCRRKDFEDFMEGYDPTREMIDWDSWIGFQFLEITRRMVLMKLPQANPWNRIFRVAENFRLRKRAALLMEAL